MSEDHRAGRVWFVLMTLLRWCILGWEGVGTSTQLRMTLYFSALHAFLLQHYNRHPYSRVSWWPYRWFLRYRAQHSYRSHIHQHRDTVYTTKLLRQQYIWHSWVHVSLFLILRDIYTWYGQMSSASVNLCAGKILFSQNTAVSFQYFCPLPRMNDNQNAFDINCVIHYMFISRDRCYSDHVWIFSIIVWISH